MEINNGNGLYDKYGLLDSVIVDLNRLNVSGVENMQIILSSISRLSALKKGLREEEKAHDSDHHQQEPTV